MGMRLDGPELACVIVPGWGIVSDAIRRRIKGGSGQPILLLADNQGANGDYQDRNGCFGRPACLSGRRRAGGERAGVLSAVSCSETAAKRLCRDAGRDSSPRLRRSTR